MKTREVVISGKKAVGFEIPLPGAPLVLVRAEKGFVMCGYLNPAAAEKLGVAAAVVRGVKTVDELLAKPVAEISPEAQKLGVTPGMTGRQAVERFLA
ncbi:MAG TPA: DUF1805 domain-containing protein [Elusimicrobiota bacterium]|nr:DUF1805 domain-containing protein [Elusimicrobiota bacterium]